MKKLIAVAAVMFAFIFSTVCANASETVPCIQAGSVEIWTDSADTVIVPVSISDNIGFASFTIDVTYDSTKLTPVSVTASDELSGYFVPNLVFKEGTVRTVFANYDNINDDINIFNIEFKISEDAYGDIPVTISCDYMSDSKYTSITPDVKNGTISAKRHSYVVNAGMADTAPAVEEDPSITSFYTTISSFSEPITSVKWKITYDGQQKTFDDMYTNSFFGTVKLGIYVEGLHVKDTSKLKVEVEVNKGGSD